MFCFADTHIVESVDVAEVSSDVKTKDAEIKSTHIVESIDEVSSDVKTKGAEIKGTHIVESIGEVSSDVKTKGAAGIKDFFRRGEDTVILHTVQPIGVIIL